MDNVEEYIERKTRWDIIGTIIVSVLLISLTVVMYFYLMMKNQDLTVMSEVNQIRSALEVQGSLSTSYPRVLKPITLASANDASERLCFTGWQSFRQNCDRIIMSRVPSSYLDSGSQYTYRSSELADDYFIEFSLKLNNRQIGLIKGVQCATSRSIVFGQCPN